MAQETPNPNDPASARRAAHDAETVEARESTPAPALAGERSAGVSYSAAAPERIGRYRIKRIIASGGMGTVFEAMQEQPRRVVALKLMRAGMTSRSALRRFDYEAQILARLRHPGIAQIYEAGTHGEGHSAVPFFAMEYVPGARTLTDYAEWKRLSASERLALFAEVCDAVHHGHQKGVIHRDLKPGNILVDSSGQVKVIDFGVARATDSDMAVTTLQTDVGQLVGTVQYMSPEQVEADPHDLDTRSDVYGLGVVMYELLTGKLPYDVSHKAVFEATRVIREQAPTRMSTVDFSLRGDVETICLKALEKDRERRYQSALDLAQDIRRYLHREPISARPPSLVYQLRVFARRNRLACGAIGAVFVVAVAAAIVSTGFAVQATRARNDALQAEGIARSEAAKAEAVNRFLQDMLASADPSDGRNRADVTVREVLDQAATTIGAGMSNQPEVEASVRATVGATYYMLGLFDQCEPHLLRALELRRDRAKEDEAGLVTSLNQLGDLRVRQGRYAEAVDLHTEAVAEAKRRSPGKESAALAESIGKLGAALRYMDRYEEAEPLYVQSLEMRRRLFGDRSPEVSASLNNLGFLYRHLGRLDDAEKALRESLSIRQALMGPDDRRIAVTMNNLGSVLYKRGDLTNAEQVFRGSYEMLERIYGTDHPTTATSLFGLAKALGDQGREAESETLLRRVLVIDRARYGDMHPEVAIDLRAIAELASKRGAHDEAVAMLREAVVIRRAQGSAGQRDLESDLQALAAAEERAASGESADSQ